MQEYWEKYMKPMDSYPAMVSFNAAVSDNMPDFEYVYVAFVKVPLNSPSKEGLISKEEEDSISFIEDRIEMESLRYRCGKYIGRIITQGEVSFIYYLTLDFEWVNATTAAMKHFPNYTYEAGSRQDSEWEVYQKLLFPTAKEWQIIQNHNTCDKLKEAGDNLRLPRAIEHKMYFENDEKRDSFLQDIEKDGFGLQEKISPTQELNLYGLQFFRKDAPYYYDIDALTLALIEKGEGPGFDVEQVDGILGKVGKLLETF